MVLTDDGSRLAFSGDDPMTSMPMSDVVKGERGPRRPPS